MSDKDTILPESVQAFLSRVGGALIGSRWRQDTSGGEIQVEYPGDGRIIATVALAGQAEVDEAVTTARRAFLRWSGMSPTHRAAALFRLADLMERHALELATLESLDVGKPIVTTRMVDVPFTIDTLRYNAGWATKLHGESFELAQHGGQVAAQTLRQPLGVVAAIVPWNFPLLQAVMKVSAALAAGCVVILKPSELTPLTALRLGELALEAGIPGGVLQILPGRGNVTGDALVAHPGVDKVSFTGSGVVGRQVAHRCVDSLKRVTLELGGKSPNIVFADADLPRAIAGAAHAIFFNAGQVCYAGSRLYIEDGVYDQVVEGIVAAASRLVLGMPLHERTELGPLVSENQRRRVLGYVRSAIDDGAQVACGGMALDRPGYHVAPTVLTDVREDMVAMREEIFGPVLCVSRFTDVKDVLARANGSPYGLAAAVWSRDGRKAQSVARTLKAGTVWINQYHVIDPHMPFGGWGGSGWGCEFGRAGVEAYTETKSIAMKL
ncbi:aldehyde dehydrogenase family protein [Luteibacter sp.]|uniref:aldehyde dehydrogenase family protein n=1 Tax=Luteibacter sp. TaxID=1886636 RepID=UPI0025C0D84F|nr:aldehyde dehydrogenase family protein [Luteibacter sp.]